MLEPADSLWPELVRLASEYARRKYGFVPDGISLHCGDRRPTFEPFPPVGHVLPASSESKPAP
jgi:hypothetical protein